MTATEHDPGTAPVTVVLSGPLPAFATTDALGGRIEARLGALVDRLGVPMRPAVCVDPGTQGQPVSVTVRGRAIDHDRSLERYVLAAHGVLGLSDPVTTSSPWDAAQQAGVDVSAAIAEVVEQTIAAQASCLLGPDELASWSSVAGATRSGALDLALKEALDLRLSIVGRTSLVNALPPDPVPGAELAEQLVAAIRPPGLEIQVEPAYLEEITTGGTEQTNDLLPYLRESIYNELGLRLPEFRIVEDATLAPRTFRFRINSLLTTPVVGFGRDRCLVNATPSLIATGLPSVTVEPSPSCVLATGSAVISDATAPEVQAAGYTTWGPFGHLVLALADTIRRNAAAFVDRTTVARELDLVSVIYPELVRSSRSVISLEQLTRLLRSLVSEGVSIRNLRHYLQAILDQSFEGSGSGSESDLLAAIRRASPRVITARAARNGLSVVAYLLDPELEAAAVEAQRTETLDDDDELRRKVVAALDDELATLPPTVPLPVLISTSSARQPIRYAIQAAWPQMAVVAYDELLPNVNIQPIARIAFSGGA